MRKLVPSVFLTSFILAVLALPTFALPVGSEAPDFALKNLDGKTIRLSDYQGRFVLLKLGSTQCPTCLEQIETIQNLGEFLKQKDIVFLDIYLRDSEEMIRETMKGETFPMTSEILVGNLDVYKAYRVFLIPRLLLIDPNGNVVRDGSVWPAYKMKQQIQELCPEDQAGEGT